MDVAFRERQRWGALTVADLLRRGLTLKQIKRMAICGSADARAALGWRKSFKRQIHMLEVLWACWQDETCRERVVSFMFKVRKVEYPVSAKRKDGTQPRYKMNRDCGLFAPDGSKRRRQFELARRLELTQLGMPGWWWVGREVAKIGREP